MKTLLLSKALAVLGLCLFFAACSAPEPEIITRPADSRYVERGRILVNGLAACGFCHGASPAPYSPLVGGRSQYDKYGEVKAPNISPSRSGIGDWTTTELFNVFRASRNREREALSPEIHRGFEWMADQDLLSVIAYLKDLPAQENKVPRRTISALDRHTTGFCDVDREVRGYVPSISPRHSLEYGQYLVNHVARCQSCHNAPGALLGGENYLAGGKVIRGSQGEKAAPGITNSEIYGIGAWSAEAIVQYLMSGKTPDNRFIDADYCPVGFYRFTDRSDLLSIARYLKTVGGD